VSFSGVIREDSRPIPTMLGKRWDDIHISGDRQATLSPTTEDFQNAVVSSMLKLCRFNHSEDTNAPRWKAEGYNLPGMRSATICETVTVGPV
jgi:hypothetical protein